MEYRAVKYKDLLNDFYFLDSEGNLRYKQKGYLNRYQQGDLVKSRVTTAGYKAIHLPKIRNNAGGSISIPVSHIIWVLSGKELPFNMELAHIDGNRLNNKLSNLRLVNRTINCKNRKKRSDNTSGITGISWNNSHNAWGIRRTVKGKRLCTYRKDLEEAKRVLAYFTSLDSDYTERHGK